MATEPDFVTVRPREVRLTHRGETHEQRAFKLPPWRTLALAGVVTALVAALFLFAPSWVPEPTVEPRAALPPPSMPGRNAPATADVDEQAPLEKLQSDRERARAQDTLSRYVELQIRLEDEMHVDAWAKDRYAAIEDVAAAGDDLFMQRKYEEAMKGYQDAATGLEALVADGEAQFEAALKDTTAALGAYDIEAARASLALAAAIHPEDSRLDAANERLAELPQLIELKRAAEESLRSGDEDGAREKYREALALDPGSTALQQALAELEGRKAERRFEDTLSAGYASLDAGRFEEARAAFNRALKERPGDEGARQGLEQVAQAGTLDRIQQLRTGAESLEVAESWAKAASTYAEVLRVDGTLKFAVDGKERTAQRAKLDAAIEDALAHPEQLSSDETYRSTVVLYESAAAIEDPGTRLTGQLQELERIIATASKPVQFTLVSDNATLVTISHLGTLGAFAEKRLELRPGRYLVVGSRDGCRDVRKQIDVAANMAPVDIRCEERL